jgi:hypothetical protein
MHSDMVMDPAGSETKNDCAGETSSILSDQRHGTRRFQRVCRQATNNWRNSGLGKKLSCTDLKLTIYLLLVPSLSSNKPQKKKKKKLHKMKAGTSQICIHLSELRFSRLSLWRVPSSGMWRRIVLVELHRHFGRTCCLRLQRRIASQASNKQSTLLSACILGFLVHH